MLATRSNKLGPTVLVVDDSPAMLRYLRMLLEVDSDRLEAVTNSLC